MVGVARRVTANSDARRDTFLRITETTFIRKLKRPDASGIWPAYLMGDDGFGTWLFTPKGSRYRGEKAGVVGYCNVGSPIGPGVAVIHLIPLTGWWIATFWDASEASWKFTVDICTPPRLADGVWTYTDLELDVLVGAETGDIQVDDEDEFVDACQRGSITSREAVAARRATDKVVQLIQDLREPFARCRTAQVA